jgi:hypothetical protein
VETASLLTRDEVRRIAVNIAKLRDSSACVVAGRISMLGLAGSRINAEQA